MTRPPPQLPQTPPESCDIATALEAFREAATPSTPLPQKQLPRTLYTPSASYRAPTLNPSSPLKSPTPLKPPAPLHMRNTPATPRRPTPTPRQPLPTSSPHNSAFNLDITPPGRPPSRPPPRPVRPSPAHPAAPSSQAEALLRSRSARLLSPIFPPVRPRPPPTYTRPDVRANPRDQAPAPADRLPPGVPPELLATVAFSCDFGFEEGLELHLGPRPTRVAMPYSVHVSLEDAPGPICPKSVKLEMHPDVRPSLLVAIISGPELLGEDESGEAALQATLLFWAAPDAFEEHNTATMLLTVTDDSGDPHETTILLSSTATEPAVDVTMPQLKPHLSISDQQLTFTDATDSAIENLVVHNITADNAPLLVSIVVAERGYGVFAISLDGEQFTDCFPAFIPGGASFRFKVRYSLANRKRNLTAYYGTIQIKLWSMFPQGTQRCKDRDLHHAYDHVIALQAYPQWDSFDDDAEFPADRSTFSTAMYPPESTELGESPRDDALGLSFKPLDVTLATRGMKPAPPDVEMGASHEGIFSLLEPVEWTPSGNFQDPSAPTVDEDEDAGNRESAEHEAHGERELSQQHEQANLGIDDQGVNNVVPADDEVNEADERRKSAFPQQDHGEYVCAGGFPRAAPDRAQPLSYPTSCKDFSGEALVGRIPEKTPFGKIVGYGPEPNTQDGHPQCIEAGAVNQPNFFECSDAADAQLRSSTSCEEKIGLQKPPRVTDSQYLTSSSPSSTNRCSDSLEDIDLGKLTSRETGLKSSTDSPNLYSPLPNWENKSGGIPRSTTNMKGVIHPTIKRSRSSPSLENRLRPNANLRRPPVPPTAMVPGLPLGIPVLPVREVISSFAVGARGLVKALSPTKRRTSILNDPPKPSAAIEGTANPSVETKCAFKTALLGEPQPKLRMRRNVRKNGVTITSGVETIVLPVSNATASQIEVEARIATPPGSETKASVKSNLLIVAPESKAQVLILRGSAKAGKLFVVLTCRFLANPQTCTTYQVPLHVEALRPVPSSEGLNVDRPTVTFYNPDIFGRQCRVRVLNGTSRRVKYSCWFASYKDKYLPQKSQTAFRLQSPPRGTVDPRSCLNIDISFEADHAAAHFYDVLNIKMNGQLQTIPIFGYTGASDIQLSLTSKGFLHAMNYGSRYGFVLLSSPDRSHEDLHAKRVVLGPGENGLYRLPHGTGTVIYTGDEIARHRLARATQMNVSAAAQEGEQELKTFTAEAFRGQTEAERNENYRFAAEEDRGLYYARRLFEAGTQQSGVDVKTNVIVPFRSLSREQADGWRASVGNDGLIHIINCDPKATLKFEVEGAEPSQGVIPALGDAKIAPFRDKVIVRGRTSSVELSSALCNRTRHR